ncbi:tripartite tricarboxylate transporter substrate binding protein [Pollutimonas bauzanensis]|uniref:Bug family tripartite tricarboxylate transporter substrate binding protein n=1 Tax=Pollutimonas bauzanensis TaxID=658167 RepID=UPI00334197B8
MLIRKLLKVCPAAILAVMTSTAQASEWPQRPVTIVVPFAPGGSTDVVARTMAQELSKKFDMQFIVENKPGGSTTIASSYVSRAKPDGYTLYIGTMGMHGMDKILYPSITYDGIDGFTHITRWVSFPMIVVANPNKGLNNFKDLIKKAKENPDQVTHASAGVGSSNHLAAVLFMKESGIKLMNIPYKGGNPATVAALSGEVDISFATPPSVIAHVKAGRLKALGLSSSGKSTLFPSIPSATESGLPSYNFKVWHGFYGPAGIPVDITDKLFNASKEILAEEHVKKTFADLGMDVDPSASVAEFNDFVRGVAATTVELGAAVQADGG